MEWKQNSKKEDDIKSQRKLFLQLVAEIIYDFQVRNNINQSQLII